MLYYPLYIYLPYYTVSVGEENHKLWHYNEGPSSSVMLQVINYCMG